MSAPLYLVAAAVNVHRAYQRFLDTDDPDELRDAVTLLLRAAYQAEPVRIVNYLTDDEVREYLI